MVKLLIPWSMARHIIQAEILLIACIFPRPYIAQKTTQLVNIHAYYMFNH